MREERQDYLVAVAVIMAELPSSGPSPDSSGPSPETPRASRKRVRRSEEWKSTQRKQRRNSGEAYVSKHGKQVHLL